MPWRVLLNSRYRVTKLALKYPFSWKLDLWRLHELAGNFLRPKMFPPSPDNGKLYSCGTQGHSHKVPLEQLYVLSAISSMACRKGAEPQRCVWHWAGGGLGGLGGLGGCQGQGKTPKEILEGQPRDEEMWTVQPRREESDGGKMKGEK